MKNKKICQESIFLKAPTVDMKEYINEYHNEREEEHILLGNLLGYATLRTRTKQKQRD